MLVGKGGFVQELIECLFSIGSELLRLLEARGDGGINQQLEIVEGYW